MCVEAMATCAKCTLAVPAKCVSEEEDGVVGLVVGAVRAVVAMVVLAL